MPVVEKPTVSESPEATLEENLCKVVIEGTVHSRPIERLIERSKRKPAAEKALDKKAI